MKDIARDWRTDIPRIVAISDAVSIALAMVTAQLARFGIWNDTELAGPIQASYWFVTLILALTWWFLLSTWASRDIRILGSGIEEFKRVAHASLALFGGLAIVSYALQVQTARGYVVLALPIGFVLLTTSRLAIRQGIVSQRRKGQLSRRLLLLGSPSEVEHLHRSLTRTPEAGYLPVGAMLPGFKQNSPQGEELLLPVVSVSTELEQILDAIDVNNADAIAISSGSILKPRTIRQLGWALHERGISMILAPALTDVAGPRLHTQPVAGLPLIHVSTPRLEGRQALLKRGFDIIGAGLITLVLSPLFLMVAIIIKISSPGPIFYSQSRIGHSGRQFNMYKFRSMIVDADDQLQSLLKAQGTSDVPLFKVENDPRITPIGRVLRQYSIDELPQLLNVLNGSMSLVGPRPQREAEVALYDDQAHRRLMVKPGMTGLWQVNGRSNLTWDEAIRWDLYYVENWSFIQDLTILFRTAKAVLAKDGAH